MVETIPQTVQVVPSNANPEIPNQMGSLEYAGQIVGDPQKFMTTDNPATTDLNESMFLGQRNTAAPGFDANFYLASNPDLQAAGLDAAGAANHWTQYGQFENRPGGDSSSINPVSSKYAMDAGGFNIGANQQVGTLQPKQANSYDVSTTQGNIAQNGQMTGAQGTLSDGSVIKTDDVNITENDMMAKDALKQSAQQNIMNIIDTSTVSGKLLAQSLGEGNYTDKKATMLGQLDILSKEFVDSNGEPKIPTWAAGTARNVAKIAAFKGMTGSAATSAMAQALMEASLPIAQEESKFFQTVTLQNLNNRQESTINRANVLAKMDLANLDNRMAAAVQNSKNFLSMDLANLDNDQQARVINVQARVQSILEDSKQENTKRMFVAQSQNEMDQFYDQLNTGIQQFNSAQTLETSKFNATLSSSREQFYKEMQYNIDVSNVNWRQAISTREDTQNFEAAAFDVKNMVGISTESLNQIWDRADSLLDYVWKSSESAKDRDMNLAIQNLKNAASAADRDSAESTAMGQALGGVVGKLIDGSGVVQKGFDSLISSVFGGWS